MKILKLILRFPRIMPYLTLNCLFSAALLLCASLGSHFWRAFQPVSGVRLGSERHGRSRRRRAPDAAISDFHEWHNLLGSPIRVSLQKQILHCDKRAQVLGSLPGVPWPCSKTSLLEWIVCIYATSTYKHGLSVYTTFFSVLRFYKLCRMLNA